MFTNTLKHDSIQYITFGNKQKQINRYIFQKKIFHYDFYTRTGTPKLSAIVQVSGEINFQGFIPRSIDIY